MPAISEPLKTGQPTGEPRAQGLHNPGNMVILMPRQSSLEGKEPGAISGTGGFQDNGLFFSVECLNL